MTASQVSGKYSPDGSRKNKARISCCVFLLRKHICSCLEIPIVYPASRHGRIYNTSSIPLATSSLFLPENCVWLGFIFGCDVPCEMNNRPRQLQAQGLGLSRRATVTAATAGVCYNVHGGLTFSQDTPESFNLVY